MRRCLHLAHATLLRRANGSCCRRQMSTMPTTPARTASRSASTSATARTAAARPAPRPPAPAAPARAAALSPDASEPPSEAKEKRGSSSSIFGRGRPVALLERHVAAAPSSPPSPPSPPPSRSSSDASLWQTGAFACEVYPDLPVAASWRGLLRAASGGLLDSQVDAAAGDAPGGGRRRRRAPAEEEHEDPPSAPLPPPSFVVRTVAAQVRGPAAVAARIQRAAGVGPGGEPLLGAAAGAQQHAPDALLLVSGGHPARSLWRPTDSLRMLEAARDLRERGLIPSGIELWGVANPLTERPERAAVEKAAAGADALVTQPPLSGTAWLRWWDGVQLISSSGSSPSVPPVVGGLALPHSAGALRFWVALCGAGGVEGIDEEVAAFAASASSPAAQREHALALARRALSLYESLGDGLAGIHVMPVTSSGRDIARELLEEGALRRWDSREAESVG